MTYNSFEELGIDFNYLFDEVTKVRPYFLNGLEGFGGMATAMADTFYPTHWLETETTGGSEEYAELDLAGQTSYILGNQILQPMLIDLADSYHNEKR